MSWPIDDSHYKRTTAQSKKIGNIMDSENIELVRSYIDEVDNDVLIAFNAITQFYTPPPFRVCDECDGRKTIISKSASYEGYAKEVSCPACHGTGRIPIWYTIQKWEELTGRKAPDDMVVWYFISPCIENDFKCKFELGTVAEYRLWSEEDGSSFSIVATEAEHPPVEYSVR